MVIKVRNSGLGIGDQITGLYAIQALKRRNPEATIAYYSKHDEWLRDVKDVVLHPFEHYISPPAAQIDLYFDSATSEYKAIQACRKSIYTDRLGVSGLKPEKPSLKRSFTGTGTHITLVPFAAWSYREWPLEKWLQLERKLIDRNYDVRIIGVNDKAHLLKRFRGKKYIGLSPDQVIDIVLSSRCVVSNDSGMAHLAGMYGVPTVVVMSSEFSREHLFSFTDVIAVSAKPERVVNGQFQFAQPTKSKRLKPSLQTITVDSVVSEVRNAAAPKFQLQFSGADKVICNDAPRLDSDNLVSILIPNYNTPTEILKQALDSCLNHDWNNKEIVVVDDGSTDEESLYYLQSCAQNKPIKVIFLRENVGISKALNLGLSYCTSEFVARMDADDIMVQGRLTAQMKLLKSDSELIAVGGYTETFGDNQGSTIVRHPERITPQTIKNTDWFFSHSAVTYRKSVILKEGGYSLGNNYPEDFELWYRLLSRG